MKQRLFALLLTLALLLTQLPVTVLATVSIDPSNTDLPKADIENLGSIMVGEGENTFTVSSEAVCVVIVSHDGGAT